jgi:hypothetical protein
MTFNMDRLTASIVDSTVKKSKRLPFEVWKPGEKLKILLVGYNRGIVQVIRRFCTER